MDFSGILNWGDIVAKIVLLNVVIDGDIMSARVEFNLNGEQTVYSIGPA